MDQQIKQYELTDGKTYPSFNGSFFFWRYHLSVDGKPAWSRLTDVIGKKYYQLTQGDVIDFFCAKAGVRNTGICPQCGGHSRITDAQTKNVVWCLCSLTDWIRNQVSRLEPYRSYYETARFSEFATSSSVRAFNEPLENMRDKSREFARFPSRWLILSGPYQVGKTHMLRAIASAIGPMALFVTVADLSNMMFEAISNHNVTDVVSAVRSAPVLLLDDIGAEHQNEFTTSKLLDIIGFRFNNPFDNPVACTTNLGRINFRTWGRTGARLLDNRFDFVELPVQMGAYQHKR